MKFLYYEFSYNVHRDRTTGTVCNGSREIVSYNTQVFPCGRGVDKATCPHCGQFVELHDVAIAAGGVQ